MLELRFIRENIELVKEKSSRRGMDTTLLEAFVEVDARRLKILAEVEGLKNKRNLASKEIARLKRGTADEKAEAEPMIVEMREIGDTIKQLDIELAVIQEELQKIVMSIPNLCDDSVPIGQDDTDNIEVRKWGEKPEFIFTPKPHWEIGENLGILDFERAAKLSGARFALLKGFASRLERVLINFMLDLHTQKHGYTEVLPPSWSIRRP